MGGSQDGDGSARADPEPSVVFGYWFGRLPLITELHFRSFLAHSRRTTYHLYVDAECPDDPIPPGLRTLLDHPRILIIPVDIRTLADEAGIPRPAVPLPRPFDRLPRLLRAMLIVALRTRGGLASVAVALVRRFRLGAVQPDYAWFSPFHHLPLFANPLDPTYRADLLRCLVLPRYADRSVLYLDLDTVITRDLGALSWDRSFAYRWANDAWANNAVLYFTARDVGPISREIEVLLRSAPTARPWVIFSDVNCRRLRLDVRTAAEFDPPWDPASAWSGDATAFFRGGDRAQLLVEEALARYPILHWHNQWASTPEPGSPFAVLLDRYRSAAEEADISEGNIATAGSA